METINIPPSKYSGEYSEIMECIEMKALKAINHGFGGIVSQHYQFANVIIDEETDNVMDLK